MILDGLFQIRLYRADRARWWAHLLIFWGFAPLLLFHALDGIVHQDVFFPGYESTLNPWLFLRNLFGLMVLAGLVMSVRRRFKTRSRLKTTAADLAALIVVAAVVCTGFLLEGGEDCLPQ